MAIMNYKINLATKMLFNKRGSLIGAILAITIGILVIHVNFVIFQGLFDAIVRDISDYTNGDVLITSDEDFITKSDLYLVNWFEHIEEVDAATPRLYGSGKLETSSFGKQYELNQVLLIGVDPFNDIRVSTAHQTVSDGQYVFARNSMTIGSAIASDLGDVKVGDRVALTVTDRYGVDRERSFVVSGISASPGGQGFDYSAVVHINTLRDMMDRDGHSSSIMVRLVDSTKAEEVKNQFLATFGDDDYEAETIEESAEQELAGFRSGIAMINMIGYFGMMSAAFAIITIQMMLVNSKTREVGIIRSIGAKRSDIMMVFLIQGMLIGAIGAGVGTTVGLAYTVYAKETNMTFAGSIPLEVSYNWIKIVQTAVLAFVLAIIASLYPSFRATKLLPVEAMRSV
ncbi:MAG: ABC transporter permease [Cenarchaeum symbiont of Oopsacas minuta]|nr:ABC transporter permease [Cenarchaeum symbiont of Oopsacas minuta]